MEQRLQIFIPLMPKPKWRIQLNENTFWHSVSAPNAFQRWMQEKAFGIKWTRLED